MNIKKTTIKIKTNDGNAASATNSSSAYPYAEIASVFKLYGFKIRVRGSSFKTSMNIKIKELAIAFFISGKSILNKVFNFELPNR